MKKQLFILALALIGMEAGAETGSNFYIYKHNGNVNVFTKSYVDSITYSNVGTDGKTYDDIVTQQIWTKDSTFKTSLSDIDSISFSNSMLPDVMERNSNIKLFNTALAATGLKDSMYLYKDETYDNSKYDRLKYVSHVNKETATVPDEHLYGFTAFCEPDSIYHTHGIYTLDQLANYAKTIYDKIYPEDAGKYDNDYKDRRNPLNRFIAYHLLDRIGQWNYLTVRDNVSIETTLANPTEWYETMMPHSIIKVEKLTVDQYVGKGIKDQLYINRRYDAKNTIEGSMIQRTEENTFNQQAANGIYYYLNDIIAFDETTRDVVDNCRMRMDISTFFPELMTNNIRMNGDYTMQDPTYDETGKYGRNYYFPDGYLKNVKTNSYFIYRRPHDYYSCYEGDEMTMFGDYDITFRLPSVPEGYYEIRMGYALDNTRGFCQMYLDDMQLGDSIDMTIPLSSTAINADYTKKWNVFTSEEKNEERMMLQEKGYYRGPASVYYKGGNQHYLFVDNSSNARRIICRAFITEDRYHTLRLRNAPSYGNNIEFMLDYIEIVPKSVYSATDGVLVEDDL